MIALSPATRIHLAAGSTDRCKSFEGLSDLVTHQFKEDPPSGHLCVFANRRKNRIKVLYFDGTGAWIRAQRLSQGCRSVKHNRRDEPRESGSYSPPGSSTAEAPPTSQPGALGESALPSPG